MGILKFAFGANYKGFMEKLAVIAKNEHKNKYILFLDASFCTVRYGSGLSDYLNYELYKRTAKERRQYVTIRTQDKFYNKVNPAEFKDTFSVKPCFLKTFKKYIKRDFFLPQESSVDELKNFLSANEIFFEKPLNGSGGKNVEKVFFDKITDVNEYHAFLLKESKFLEAQIIQHDAVNAICKESVNTIRVMSSSTSGTPEIVFAALRIGNGNCPRDNFHSGGMGVYVDIETGKLVGKAVDKDLNWFECHPKSGFKFDGAILPYWQEAKQMILEAALVEPRIMMIGWDVAITPDGPIFVEANRRPGFDLVQALADKGRKDIIRKALDGLKERENKLQK